MCEKAEDPILNDEHHKDSCTISVQVSKQFLTFAATGLAFLIGIAIKAQCNLDGYWYLSGFSLVLSMLLGLFYLMSVVAHINQCKNYNVYALPLKVMSTLQIIAFALAVAFLAIVTQKVISSSKPPNINSAPNVSIETDTKKVHFNISALQKSSIKLIGSDIEILIEPLKTTNTSQQVDPTVKTPVD
jgi:hypothetical protein